MAVADMASARCIVSASAYCVISTRNPPPVIAIRFRRECCRRLTLSGSLNGGLLNGGSLNGGSLNGGSLNGGFFRTRRDVQRARRLRGFEIARAGIDKKKKREEALDGFAVSLDDVKPSGGDLSQLTVSLPLGLASAEGLFLAGWIASLRGMFPGAPGFFGAADIVLSGIMFANCAVGWYALERSRSEMDELQAREKNNSKLARKLKPAVPGLLDLGLSLALSFIPFANLFLWLKLANTHKHLSAEAKAALVANALIYEAPRLFALLFFFGGGLFAFLQVGFVSNFAVLLSAIHRPFAEARVKNEKVLMEVWRAKKIGGKKGEAQKPKEISPEEKERIARLKELEEFDVLLAQRSSPGTAVLPAKVKDWSVGETMEWLGQQGFARYATTFAENHIDGELLLQLTNDDLRDELQILSFGDRRKLELLIQQLKGKGRS